MSGEKKLLPCPFCGGRAEWKQGHYTGYVMCLSCEVMGPNIDKAEAIAAWNTRASPPPAQDLSSTDGEGIAAALVALAEAGVQPDTQELLVFGSPRLGIKPGALAKAIKAAAPPPSLKPVADLLRSPEDTSR